MFNPEFLKYLNDNKLSPHKFGGWPNDARIQFAKGLAQFFREPMTEKFIQDNQAKAMKLQHWTDKLDFPAANIMYPSAGTINGTPYWDEGFRDIFDVMDFTGTGKGGFRELTLANTITSTLVLPGDKALIYNISGAHSYVPFDKYGAGLEWDKIVIEDNEWLQMGNILAAFRAAVFSQYAQVHYNLLEAVFAGKGDIAWQVPDPAGLAVSDATYTANRDAQTINLACQTIALACKNKGYNINPRSGFIVLCPLQARARVRRALGLSMQPFNGAEVNLDYNVTQITTMMLATTTKYIVCYPKFMLQSGLRLNLEELTDSDILARSNLMVDWMRYGAAVGDIAQVERCAMS